MTKVVLVLAVLAVFLIAESTQRFIHPTYRPPPTRRPTYRFRREADDQPLGLWQGDNNERAPSTADHPFLPFIIDDIKQDTNRRTARSLSTPRATRGGGTRRVRDTGPWRSLPELRLPGHKLPLPTTPPFNPRSR